MGTSNYLDLFLIRHGITDWNKEKRYLGHTDQGVIKSELELLSDLKFELKKIHFDQVYTSDLCRCKETLAYLNLTSLASVDSRLRELHFGDWEGKTYQDLKMDKEYKLWLNSWEDYQIPNGESFVTFKTRIDLFLEELFHDSTQKNKSNILVMTHGGVIRYFVSKVLPETAFWDVTINHGNGVKLTMEQKKGEWVCNSLLVVPFQEKGNG
ncbi:histidine phosphatase family protein [Litchfieldia salsa]|uniref:Alpha-ribazole phosphatase n=1 Tax=Litchfieldia salsa TaxID=930152 RepID=A0A1H0UR82_9BACI|nr:histidine phosphatase family protein [Litchfieldia salsa]SDP68737.1 alpha-ribazole phosphatase [Litchfieldia salsa]